MAAMPWRSVALASCLVAALTLPARATPPPMSETEARINGNETEIEEDLARCSDAATAHRRYGVAEVVVIYGRSGRPRARLDRGHNLGAGARCVRRALAAATLTPLPARHAAFRVHHDFAIGEVRPLFAPGFLAAWQAAVAHPEAGRARLASFLPDTVRRSGRRCLVFDGPEDLYAALEEWLDQRTSAPVTALFGYYARPGDWWLTLRSMGTEGDFVRERDRGEICLDHVDPIVSTLRRAAGRLWQTVGAHAKIYSASWDRFDAEWVIDRHGRVSGDVALCLPTNPDLGDYLRQALPIATASLRAAIAAIDFGPQPRLRHVALHYHPEGRVEADVRGAAGPLARGESRVQRRCGIPE
jgi:hypothetical protein